VSAPTGHSRFGFSSFSRRAACPASATREDGISDTSSPAAELGTLLHELAALVLVGELDMASVRDRVDKRSAEQVEIYVDYVSARHKAIGGRLLVERRFHIPLHEELWGTSDAVIANARKRTIEVIDLKTGGGYEVRERDDAGRINVQLAGYLLGALHMTPGRFDKLFVTVVQPRRGGIKQTLVTWDELIDLSGDLVAVIERALGPNPPAVPGDHCTFCRAKPTCAEFSQRKLIEARAAFDAEPLPAGSV
jgi:hypothetical protein